VPFTIVGLELRLGLGLDLVSGWLLVHAHVYVLIWVVTVTLPTDKGYRNLSQ